MSTLPPIFRAGTHSNAPILFATEFEAAMDKFPPAPLLEVPEFVVLIAAFKYTGPF